MTLSGDGTGALIGADGSAGGTGAAYSYTRSGGVWGTERKLTASDGAAGDAFGLSVALNGDASVALIGAPGSCGCSLAGAAYAYTRSGNT